MPVFVESRRKKRNSLEKRFPGAVILDVTSKGEEPWVCFSPFYPHGGIPIPNTPGITAESVEGLWQGLKVFEHEDIDPSKWRITNRQGIKRGGRSRGKVVGHRFGVGSPVLLGYHDARIQIYLPAYHWVLQHRLQREVEELRQLARHETVLLLDYETNARIEDLSRPLSHAALIKYHLEGCWPHCE
jgi:hypothetical protein